MKFIAVFFLSNVAASGLEVTGYIGNSVNLALAVDPSWKFISIKWSIYFNDTLIATCRNQTANTDRFYLFKNRLRLNCSTEDALVYTVERKTTDQEFKPEKIKLLLREHLKKPAINKLFSHPVDGGCWIAFQCRPQDEGTSLSWNVNPKSTTSYLQNHLDKNVSVILTFSNHIQHGVEFTCSSSRDSERAESTIREQCPDKADAGDSITGRERYGLILAIGLVAGPVILIFLKCLSDGDDTTAQSPPHHSLDWSVF
ncbi:uncharacterized protein ACB058_002028 isoform 2-T2 [Synchiropus picturatus]